MREELNGAATQDAQAEDHVHFVLSPQKWEEFCAALNAPPKVFPKLLRLLAEPGRV